MLSGLDCTLRHQLLTERVKRGREAEVAALLLLLRGIVLRHMAKLTVATFADMSRAQFNAFVAAVMVDINEALNEYRDATFEWVQDYSNAESVIMGAVFTTLTGIAPADKASARNTLYGPQAGIDPDALWKKIAVAVMAANGMTIWQTLVMATQSAAVAIQRRLMMAQPNAETPAQTRDAIVGTDAARGLDGVTNGVGRAAQAVNRTIIQHTAAAAEGATSSLYYDRYQWVSVLDSKTTLICTERDGRVYEYGQGPLPPAHINCRSSIVGYSGAAYQLPRTVDEWLGTQPATVRSVLEDPQGLTIDELEGLVPTIVYDVEGDEK